MPLHPIQYSFAGGEISEILSGRVDLSRYFSSLQLCQNYRTTPQGAAIRRDGTQFIAEGKLLGKNVRLELFEFSVEQAYIMEIGEFYIRFYTPDLNRLEVGGVPVEVVTPFTEAQLFDVQIIQSADIAFFSHPDHPPQSMRRLSATVFEFAPRTLFPPPSTLAPTFFDATLTLAAVSGLDVLITLTDVVGDAAFLDGDIDRALVAGRGVGIIRELVGDAPTTQAKLNILTPFASVGPFLTTEWFQTLSPTVTLVFNKFQPRGAEVTIKAERIIVTAPDEIINGDFSQGATGWDNLSAPLVVTGTHDGPTSSTTLVDSTTDFVAVGSEAGHRVLNITDGTEGRADTFATTTNPNDTINLNPGLPSGNFNNGNTYEVRQTGAVSFSTGSARLSAQENGIGHTEQVVTGLVLNSRYRIEFDVAQTPVVFRVGSTSGGVDIVAKTTFSIGLKNILSFDSGAFTTLFIGFSNEQGSTTGDVDNVSLKRVSATAFHNQDVGKHIVGAEGVIVITQVIDNENAIGLIFAAFDSQSAALQTTLTGSVENFLLTAGFWTLEVAAFSTIRGFPRGQTFHQARLWYLGTRADPLNAWGSVTGDFLDFSRGTEDSDAIDVTISANQMNTLEWGEPFRDLLVGTRGGEHMLTSGTAGAITPGNIGQIPQGTAGSPPLRPIRTDAILIHLQRGRRKVREIAIDPDVVQLSQARDLTVLNPGITRTGIRQWTLQQQPFQTVWAVREDGVLIALTLDVIEQVRGWHRHTTPGTFVSIMRIPVDNSATEETEQIWVAVKRTIEGVVRTYIEVMVSGLADDTQQRAELTVDSALRFSGAPSTTFSGLDHLEGRTVRLVSRDDSTTTLPTGETVQTDKLTDLGDQVVVGGQVTTDDPVTKLDAGLQFDSRLGTLRPEIPQDDGTLQGRLLRWVRLSARLIGTLGMELAGNTIAFREVADLMDIGLLPQNVDVFSEGTNWTLDGRILVEQTLALPSTVLSLVGDIEFEEVE